MLTPDSTYLSVVLSSPPARDGNFKDRQGSKGVVVNMTELIKITAIAKAPAISM